MSPEVAEAFIAAPHNDKANRPGHTLRRRPRSLHRRTSTNIDVDASCVSQGGTCHVDQSTRIPRHHRDTYVVITLLRRDRTSAHATCSSR